MMQAMPRERVYTVHVAPDPEGNGYTVVVPAMPEVCTYGATVEHALASAQDAIALWIADLAARGLPIPEDAPAAGTYVLRVAA